MSTEADFKCFYRYKIGGAASPEMTTEFSRGDVENQMVDLMLDSELPVKAGQPITIMVRFTAGDEYFCTTLLGYGGENY